MSRRGENALKTLERIVGAENCVGASEARGLLMAGAAPAVGAVYPSSVEEIQEIVRVCKADRLSVIPAGACTMSARSARPDSYDVAVVTTHLRAVTDYQTENLVFAAEAGLTGREARERLAANNQLLALDPPQFDRATLGGMVACRASGPARFAHGTARDAVIGLSVVNADGEVVRAGGKVVKNVSGYDLCKLYTGSLGTLGIIVETVFRLQPLPEMSVASIAAMESWVAADALTARVMSSELAPRSIEVFNRAAARHFAERAAPGAPCYLLAAFDGVPEQVEFQLDLFERLSTEAGASSAGQMDLAWNSPAHQALANVDSVSGHGGVFIMRGLSSDIPVLAEHAEKAFQDAGFLPRIIASAGNGVLRVALDECTADKHEEVLSALSARAAGQNGISLQSFSGFGAEAARTWMGETGGLELMRGIKRALDPDGVFASGRFVGGI